VAAPTPLHELLRRFLPGVWLGVLAAIAGVAMPSAFAALDRAAAGQLARVVFEREAMLSLAFGVLVLIAERRAGVDLHESTGASQFTSGMMLALGAIFCTVAGFYGLQPMMEAARAGQATALTFGQLHLASLAFFAAKALMVMALAWKALRRD
jgi:hypothetical protein